MEPVTVQPPAASQSGTEPAPPVLEAPPGRQSAAMAHAATRAVLLAAALVVAGLLFHKLVTLVAAGIITVILAIVLSTLGAPLMRRGLPRPAAALVALLLVLGIVGGILALVVPALVTEIRAFGASLPDTIDELTRRLASITGGDPKRAGANVEKSIESMTGDPGRYLGPLASVGLGVAGAISSVIVIVITAFYMAANPQPLIDGTLRLFPPARREWACHLLMRLRESWSGWLKGVAVDMAVTGVLLYLGLTLIGLDYAILFAVLSCLLVVVPYFGAIAGGIPPVLVALADSPQMALMTFVVYLVVQQVEGNVIVPLVMARTVKLHPAVIAIGVVVVAQLFGLVGLFVAVPILSAVVILAEELWVRPVEHVASEVELPAVIERAGSGRFS